MLNKEINVESNSILNNLKVKFSNETGIDISEYKDLDKGSLTSRQNGYVGGYIGGNMTKRLIDLAEQQITKKEL